jgi:hypothetical protein
LSARLDADGKQVDDGSWVIIAGRRVSLNTRFAMPDGILNVYEPGSEGPQWWGPWPDTARGLPVSGILDRCMKTHTCLKIFAHFGSAEVWVQPNQRMKLSRRGGHTCRTKSVLSVPAAPRSLCASRQAARAKAMSCPSYEKRC